MSLYHEKIKEIKKHGNNYFMKIHPQEDKIILRLVDTSDETVHLLTKWREKYWQWFGTKFDVKEKNTKRWIETIINDPDRILFVIFVENKKVGQFGVFHYDKSNNSAEIDNILMGERVSHVGVMEKIGRAVLGWLFNEIKLSKINLKVFSDNYRAINLYERCGLLTVDSVPLKRTYTADGWIWEKTKLRHEDEYAERYYNTMEITRQRFEA